MAFARDELDIQRLLSDYAWACDNADWEMLGALFTTDAHLDYAGVGGPVGLRDEVLPWLVAGLKRVHWIQHGVSNFQVDVDASGDGAQMRTLFLVNAHLRDVAEPLVAGGYYVTDHVRAGDGWRIRTLREDNRWMQGHGHR